MSSRLDVNTLMEQNKSDLKAAEETMPMVAVDNRNWTAVISLLKRSCEVQEELLELQVELMMKSGIETYLNNRKVLFGQDEDIERHSDSKVLAEEIRRKEALGMRMG